MNKIQYKNLIKAAGKSRNINYVWAVGNSLYMNLADGRRMNYLKVLDENGVSDIKHLNDQVYMIRLDTPAYLTAEQMTSYLDAHRRWVTPIYISIITDKSS